MVLKIRNVSKCLHTSTSDRRKSPSHDGNTSNKIPNQFLSSVVELIATVKSLLAWLDRTPLTGISDFTTTKNKIIHLCLELTTTVQQDCSVYHIEEKVISILKVLNSICDETVRSTSHPLMCQSACLQEVQLTNITPGEGLGMYIKSTYDGLHIITGTTENVGWQLKNLVSKLKENPKYVILLLKKRPAGTPGFMPAPLKNMRWKPAVPQSSSSPSKSQSSIGCIKVNVRKEIPALLDLYIPPPPSVPYTPREVRNTSHTGMNDRRKGSESPNSCLDLEGHRRFTITHDDKLSVHSLEVNVQMRSRGAAPAHGNPRPLSMPTDTCLNMTNLYARPCTHARKGQMHQYQSGEDFLCTYLSNERISSISEESSGSSYRRVTDRSAHAHRYLFNTELHNTDTIPYHHDFVKNTPVTSSLKPPAAEPSLLVSWITRLKVFTH